MSDLNEEFVSELYHRYADDLRAVREEQRALRAGRAAMRTQLDDIEAEITYLLLRWFQPGHVTEIGCLHGWSTTWILRALRDNDHGRLTSVDLIDNARGNVPAELAKVGWQFQRGDAREIFSTWSQEIDYLFIDAAHTASFARWYLDRIFPALSEAVPVSVHDVFHRRRPLPFSEASEVLKWLRGQEITYFTASRAKAPQTYTRLERLRRELGLTHDISDSQRNPMIYFHMAGRTAPTG
ncbi:class I SAM-dependent methyltransferase [Salinactinospora qingdaonensis]|uniref:Methyltransferase domain-containing protein n=1 Tax=Salinactinospora qingdaonensis TaxID=702744 RepID=A0ABP7FAI2_9ACTN